MRRAAAAADQARAGLLEIHRPGFAGRLDPAHGLDDVEHRLGTRALLRDQAGTGQLALRAHAIDDPAGLRGIDAAEASAQPADRDLLAAAGLVQLRDQALGAGQVLLEALRGIVVRNQLGLGLDRRGRIEGDRRLRVAGLQPLAELLDRHRRDGAAALRTAAVRERGIVGLQRLVEVLEAGQDLVLVELSRVRVDLVDHENMLGLGPRADIDVDLLAVRALGAADVAVMRRHRDAPRLAIRIRAGALLALCGLDRHVHPVDRDVALAIVARLLLGVAWFGLDVGGRELDLLGAGGLARRRRGSTVWRVRIGSAGVRRLDTLLRRHLARFGRLFGRSRVFGFH